MPYLSERELDDRLSLPVNLPGTLLQPGEWLPIFTHRLRANGSLTLRRVTLSLIGIEGVPPHGLSQPGLGLAYLGFYLDPTLSGQTPPTGATDILTIGTATTLPPLEVNRVTPPSTFTVAGNYAFVLVNNTTNRALNLAVSGAVLLDLSAL
jgi:hypothetical protein